MSSLCTKAVNNEFYVRHVCKLFVILLLSFLGMRERSISMCSTPYALPWKNELVQLTFLKTVNSEGVQNEVRDESRGLCLLAMKR